MTKKNVTAQAKLDLPEVPEVVTPQRIVVTGHRPQKLFNLWSLTDARIQIEQMTLDLVAEAKVKPIILINGMALGFDSMMACAAIRARVKFQADVSLHAYVPFEGQEQIWQEPQQQEYHWMLGRAQEIVLCNEGGYAAWKMQDRNRKMVDAADRMISCWDGSSGGTANCIQYASLSGMEHKNCYDDYFPIGGLAKKLAAQQRAVDPEVSPID